jgi:adenine phosphoribosyltransferase
MYQPIDLASYVRDVPDFPKPGILFRDITPLLKSPEAVAEAVGRLVAWGRGQGATLVAGIESRGFLFGLPVAQALSVGFVPVRKPGKLPAETIAQSYELEYGSDTLEIHADAVTPDDRVLIVDDLLATGGTAAATARLFEQAGAQVAGLGFVIELGALNGRALLEGRAVEALLLYE